MSRAGGGAALALGAAMLLASSAIAPGGAYVPDEILAHEARGTILIDGDAVFTRANGVRGGSGAPDDPYVIARWSIVPDGVSGVHLAGTRAHVVIEDVVVLGGAANIATCPVRRCSGAQVFLHDAENVTLRRAHVGGHIGVGVYVRASDRVVIEDVTVGEPGLARDEGFTDALYVADSGEVHARALDLWATFPLTAIKSRSLTVERSALHLYRAQGELQPIVGEGYPRAAINGVQHVTIRDTLFDRAHVGIHGAERAQLIRNEFRSEGDPLTFGAARPVGDVLLCGNEFSGSRARWGAPLEMVSYANAHVVGNRFEDNEMAARFEPPGGTLLFERNLVTGSREPASALLFQGVDVVARENRFEGNAGPVSLAAWWGQTEPPTMDVRGNWWGDASGPSGAGPGAGNALRVSDIAAVHVEFQPWLTTPPPLDVDCDALAWRAG